MYMSKTSGVILRPVTCNSCNIGMRDLPDMYALSPQATGLRAKGIHIRQITNGQVTILCITLFLTAVV